LKPPPPEELGIKPPIQEEEACNSPSSYLEIK
jgi:hypothetical protein